MAKQAEQIRVTYQELKTTGNELKANAEKYTEAMNEAVRLVAGLTGSEGWTGAAQQVYVKQMQKLQNGINQMMNHISSYQNSLDQAAQHYNSTEQSNVSKISALLTNIFD